MCVYQLFSLHCFYFVLQLGLMYCKFYRSHVILLSMFFSSFATSGKSLSKICHINTNSTITFHKFLAFIIAFDKFHSPVEYHKFHLPVEYHKSLTILKLHSLLIYCYCWIVLNDMCVCGWQSIDCLLDDFHSSFFLFIMAFLALFQLAHSI